MLQNIVYIFNIEKESRLNMLSEKDKLQLAILNVIVFTFVLLLNLNIFFLTVLAIVKVSYSLNVLLNALIENKSYFYL